MPILLIVLSFLTQNQLFAQHISTRSNQVDGDIYHIGGAIGIGTATVANSALLELQSTEKGILIPRLSTAEMLAITSPANSLLIYNTTEKAFMFYDQTNQQWRIMVASTPTTGSELLWGRAGSKNGTTFLANPNDKVGIGTETPTASLEIVPNTDNALRILTSTTGTPANIQLADQTNANFVGFTAPDNLTENIMFELPATRGDSGQVLTTDGTGKLIWDDKGGAYELWYRDGENTYLGNINDNVGFGTQKPYKTLHVFRNYNETQEKSTLRLDNLYENGQDKGYKIWDIENNANFLQVYYSEGGKYGYLETTQPFTFENNGKIGLNTTTPQANIHIVDIEKNKRSNILLESKFSNKSKHPPYDLSFLEMYSERGIVGLDYSIDNNKPITLLEYEDGSPLKLFEKVTISKDGYVNAERYSTGNDKFTADNQGNVSAKTYNSNNFHVNAGGEVTAERFAGDGAYLTNLNPNNIAGTIPESKIENGEYMINSAGTTGQVWTADGQGRGLWQQIPDNNIWHVNNSGIDYNGNVGIGTTSPTEELEIVGTVKSERNVIKNKYPYLYLYNSDSESVANERNWYITSSKTGSFSINMAKDDYFWKKTALTIKQNGNIGIGTDTPDANLHIKNGVEDLTLGEPGANIILESYSNVNPDVSINWRFRNSGMEFCLDREVEGEFIPVAAFTLGQTHFRNSLSVSKLANNGNYIGKLFYVNSSFLNYNDVFKVTESEMYYTGTGNFGIGTNSPTEKLQIGDRWTFHNGTAKVIGYNFKFESGVDKRIKQDEVAQMRFTAGGDIEFRVAPEGNAGSIITDSKTPLTIANNGEVWVNNVLYVQSQNPWVDYVFDDNYNLMPIDKLDKYIKANKHLPEIPTAKTIEEKGIDIAKITTLQMKKIEELTLYIIEQNKQIKQLQKEINNLKNK